MPDNTNALSGGIVTTIGNQKIHTFLGNGVLTVTEDVILNLLVVGGGGSGGADHGGGGGAGQFIYSENQLIPAGSYPIVIGAGGAYIPSGRGAQYKGNNGGITTFHTYTAIGGGGGGTYFDTGRDGASGGGAGHATSNGWGQGTAGFHGGDGNIWDVYGSGGGGGSSEVGGNCYNTGNPSISGGRGGQGTACLISGESVLYAGGGGGCYSGQGMCRGGNGWINGANWVLATDAAPNSGSGGGGGGSVVESNNGGQGGAGGSGIIIISYTVVNTPDIYTGKLQLRGGTTSEWSSANPVLLFKEVGLDITLNKLKIGDGSTPWNSLPFAYSGIEDRTSDYDATIDNRGKIWMRNDLSEPIVKTIVYNSATSSYIVARMLMEGDVPVSATLSGVPLGTVSSTSASIDVGGETVVTYKYSLDGGAYGVETLISTPISLTNLSDGNHHIAVIGKNSNNVWQNIATSDIWIVDASVRATLSGVPSGTVNSTSASIRVEGEGVIAYIYSLDGGAYSSEKSLIPAISLSNLSSGNHTISVKGRNLSHRWQVIPTTASWIIDTLAVVANGIITGTSLNVVCKGPGVVAYKYSLDGGAQSDEIDINTPISLTDLSEGYHTISIVGRDVTNRWQTNPTVYNPLIDITAPFPLVLNIVECNEQYPSNQYDPGPVTSIMVTGPSDLIDYNYAYSSANSGGGENGWFGMRSISTPILIQHPQNFVSLWVKGCDASGNWTNVKYTTWTPVMYRNEFTA